MYDDDQLHIALVTQQRRRIRPEEPKGRRRRSLPQEDAAASDAPRQSEDPSEAHSHDEHREHHHGEHHGEHDEHHHSEHGEHREHRHGEHHGEHHTHHHGEHHHSEGSGGEGSRHSSGSGHRRTYQDYGTLTLGCMDGSRGEDEPGSGEPSQGQLQKEFYDKYDAVLNRRYHTRNKSKVNRILLIILLAGLVLILSLVGVGNLTSQTAETLARPPVETLPVETLDLGG